MPCSSSLTNLRPNPERIANSSCVNLSFFLFSLTKFPIVVILLFYTLALVTILEYNHYSVDAVYNGEDALYYLLNGNYDGAILDVMMPKMDGINAADGTTAIPGQANSNCPILISGGNINAHCVAREGDGIYSNGSVLINGGYVYVNGSSSNGDAALDSGGGILVDGGYLFAVGQLGMVETPASNSAQYVTSYARNKSISESPNLYLCNSNRDILTELITSRIYQSVII